MVSTRRGAQSVPDVAAENDISLRKKPVRKASVKAPAQKANATRTKKQDGTAEESTSKPATKAKATRTTTRTAASEQEKPEAATIEVEEVVPKTARTTTTRAEKGQAVTAPKKAPARSQQRTAPKASDNLESTKTFTTRKKEEDVSSESQPKEDEAQPVKAVRTTRATRATRATVAKEKSRALSPKKITQVSKVAPKAKATKITKSNSTAEKAKQVDNGHLELAKRTTRKRAFSDENADSLGDPASLHQSPVLRTKRPRKAKVVEDETIVSAPSGSRSEDVDEMEEHIEEAADAPGTGPDVAPAVEPTDDQDDDLENSIDELCGPTTPMKRCSPHKSTTQTGLLYSASRMRTPIRRFQVFGGRLRTPKSQRPYAKNIDFDLESSQSMTVTRGRDRAMVFRQLEALPEMPDVENVVKENAVLEGNLESSIAEDTERSEVVYEFDLSEMKTSQQLDESFADSQDATDISDISVESEADLSSTPGRRTIVNEAITTSAALSGVPPPASEEFNDSGALADFAPIVDLAAPSLTTPEQPVPTAPLPVSSPVKDPALQTLVWQNLDQSAESDNLTLSPAGDQFQSSVTASICQPVDANIACTSPGLKAQNQTLSLLGPSSHKKGTASARPSLDATVHFSEFIDAGALSETSQIIESLDPSIINDHSRGATSELEARHEIAESSSNVATPSRVSGQHDLWSNDFQFTFEVPRPHYALPTISSRRKSLPSVSRPMPPQIDCRPKTSDGSPSAGNASQMVGSWLNAERAIRTPTKYIRSNAASPRDEYPKTKRTPRARTPANRTLFRECRTEASKSRLSAAPSNDTLAGLHITPVRVRRPIVTNRESASPHTPQTPSADETTDEVRSMKTRKRAFDDYSRTAIPSSRFRSPIPKSSKRPASARKPMSMREQVMRTSTMQGSRTPTKTPLKASAMTPGFVVMTPHPSAPLRGVFALVEVFTNEGASASSSFVALLQRLGAKATKTWNSKITHVVFKDGSPNTLQRLRLHNKEVVGLGTGLEVLCVNSRWVSDCDADGTRLDEHDESYAVDVDEVPRGGKRRRKSMEPSALTVIGGNIVRDRKSSSTLRKCSTPEPESASFFDPNTPSADHGDGENEPWSPSTPAYLAEPSSLVQQTAPANRIRKLDMKGADEVSRNRRLTFWDGGA